MKRVKIMVGAALLTVAFAGAAFTSANAKRVTYYYQQSAAVCQAVNLTETTCVVGDVGCIVSIPNVGPRQIYRDAPNPSTTTCKTPFKVAP